MALLLETLSKILISQVTGGKHVGEPFLASKLWSEAPAIVYVVRRPGCAFCREDALELSSRFGTVPGSKGGAGAINLFGIIKEVDADPEGVVEFQTKYFNLNELYIDREKQFYASLGNKSLWAQSWGSWNPITLYKDFNKLTGRMKEKNIEGNLKGEGFLKGGLYVISPTEGIVYTHLESTGSEMPYAEIEVVVAKLLGVQPDSNSGADAKVVPAVQKASADAEVCASRETCGEK